MHGPCLSSSAATLAEAVVDVSVTMQLQFQQGFVDYVEVPQLQFFDRVVVQLLYRDRYTVQTVQKSVVILQVQFLDRLGHARRCATTGWMVQTVQKTGEVPQVQYCDKVVDVPACSSSTRFGCRCDLAVTAVKAFLAHFAPFFALLRLSGVERQVSVGEPSMTKSSSSSRAGGGADAGSFSQVSGHQLCIISS